MNAEVLNYINEMPGDTFQERIQNAKTQLFYDFCKETVSVETIIQDDSTSLTYTGTWLVDNNSSYNGGSAKYTSVTGSKVAFSFTGNKLELYTSTYNNRGIAKITVDSTVYNVDMYSAPVFNNVKVFELGGLADGVHNVSIECTGNKNPNSSSSIVIIDYIKTYASITNSIDEIDKNGEVIK